MINGIVSCRYVDIARGGWTSGWPFALQINLRFSVFWLATSIVAIMIRWRLAIDRVCQWHWTNLWLCLIWWLKLLIDDSRAIVLTAWYHLVGQRFSIDWNWVSLCLLMADYSSAVHLTSWYISQESILATRSARNRIRQRFDVLTIRLYVRDFVRIYRFLDMKWA